MKQSDFKDLPQLSVYRFENFLNIYTDENQQRFYNLLRGINIIPANDSSLEDTYYVELHDTWLYISYQYYGTIYLWWLVCEYNRVANPVNGPTPGSTIKLLKKDYVWSIITNLNKQVNN